MIRRPRLFRARPLDYTRGRACAPASKQADVVVPVYGAFELLERCLRSLARHTDLTRDGLVLVLDGPGQEQAERLAERCLPAGSQVQVLRNVRRLGFVGAANRGVAAGARDVVLLNSDTEVTAGWLDKLRAAAASDPAIASVTPFCNDATLCSLPRAFAVNRLPAGHDLTDFAQLVERAALRAYPRLPTGVGVCLYVKRAAIAALERPGSPGLLDERAFGLGYGEENDFCFRALAGGFVHVLDDATFVYHAGHASFGRERHALQRRAARTLRRRHPAYFPTIAAFMRADPLAPARARVLAALAPAQRRARAPERVLHVVHGWPPFAHGGTETYARGLAQSQAEWRAVAAYARLSDPARQAGETVEYQDGAVRVRLLVNDFTQRDPLARNALINADCERDLELLLDEFQPQLVHVHHLAGHAVSLLPVLRHRKLPVVYQLQDWWAACARSNLVTRSGEACAGPTLARCARCFDLTRVRPAALTNRALHVLRRRLMHTALHGVQAIVAGSQAVVTSHRAAGLLADAVPVHVVPYGVTQLPLAARLGTPTAPLRFGFVGTLMPHKGAHVAVQAFAAIAPEQATLDVWGSSSGAPDYARRLQADAGPGVRFHGSFHESEKARVLSAIDVLVVPSIGLESFGLIVNEAVAAGVPVLASRLGALEERIAQGSALGFTAGDADALRAHIAGLAAQPQGVAAWRARLPRVQTVSEHAEEIEAIYLQVLQRVQERTRSK